MSQEVTIPVRTGQVIRADVSGEPANGVVVFVHGSGSSRRSPRNRYVAGVLQEAGLRTVLLDLLTEEEERRDLETREHRFDIDLLTDRVLHAMEWVREGEDAFPVGLFGASTGAAAALRAAAAEPEVTGAVVSRGGRPDLALEVLSDVAAPCLLVVGGDDTEVLHLNEIALTALNDQSSLRIVEGAGHLFEESGKLEVVAAMASDWFNDHLATAS